MKIHIHFLLAIFVTLLFGQPINAQEVTIKEVQYKATSDYSTIDLLIPENTSQNGLAIWCKGADGGLSTRHNGGGGAKAHVEFYIGEEDNQIPPGSTIRLIIGHKGARHDKGSFWGTMGAGGGGGGGSAVLLLPKGSTNWNKSKILLVAGGGGGGGYHGTGQSGNDGENGTAGHDNDGNGLGNGGSKYLPAGRPTEVSSGGASAFKDAAPTTDASACKTTDPTAHAGYPSGGAGAICFIKGGWGFGGGGSGNTAGGGGGGYYGGGGGNNGGGGGGGSFISPDFQKATHEIITYKSASSPANGNIIVVLKNL